MGSAWCVTDTAHKTQLKASHIKAAAYRTYSNHSGQSAQTRGWRRLTEAPFLHEPACSTTLISTPAPTHIPMQPTRSSGGEGGGHCRTHTTLDILSHHAEGSYALECAGMAGALHPHAAHSLGPPPLSCACQGVRIHALHKRSALEQIRTPLADSPALWSLREAATRKGSYDTEQLDRSIPCPFAHARAAGRRRRHQISTTCDAPPPSPQRHITTSPHTTHHGNGQGWGRGGGGSI